MVRHILPGGEQSMRFYKTKYKNKTIFHQSLFSRLILQCKRIIAIIMPLFMYHRNRSTNWSETEATRRLSPAHRFIAPRRDAPALLSQANVNPRALLTSILQTKQCILKQTMTWRWIVPGRTPCALRLFGLFFLKPYHLVLGGQVLFCK